MWCEINVTTNNQRASGCKDEIACITGIKFQKIKTLSGIVSSGEKNTVLERAFFLFNDQAGEMK